VDRIKRISYEVLDKHKSKFGEDFADNKKSLDEVSIIRSKGLKNKVADLEETLKSRDYTRQHDYQFLIDENSIYAHYQDIN